MITAATSTSRPTLRARTKRASCTRVQCVVGEHWVVTAHDRPIVVLDEFAARVSGSGDTGSLDGPGFLAALLEWVLGSYTAAFERVEQRLEEFDVHAMRGQGTDQDIERLIEMRREVGSLRRALAAHRSALVALTHPELEALGSNASGERFESLFTRFESTLQEARDAREAIVGSFDVLVARAGHHTNQIMKVLTLTSVILLPGALLASRDGHELQGRSLRHVRALLGRRPRDRRSSATHPRHRQAAELDLIRRFAAGH
jgi:Mg2+ and Co2+ transporter CorA